MDQTTYSYSSSSSSSTTSSSSLKYHPSKTTKSIRRSYSDSLHSTRKPTQKPITKQFIAPMPPTPAKIYNVDPSNFKEAVRMLTSTREFQSWPTRRLKDIAPPPLILSTIPKPYILSKPQPPTPAPAPPPPPASVLSEGEGTTSPLSGLGSSPDVSKLLNETLDTNRFVSNSPLMDYFGSLSPLGLTLSPEQSSFDPFAVAVMSPLGLNMSPSSLAWCSSLLMSPTNLSVFNQSPI